MSRPSLRVALRLALLATLLGDFIPQQSIFKSEFRIPNPDS
jgi:hypothetical protein